MSNETFRINLSRKSDAELLQILSKEHNSYNTEALEIAKAILRERNVLFFVPESISYSTANTNLQEDASFIAAPLLTGMLMAGMAFINLPVGDDTSAALSVFIFVNLFIRVVVLLWISSLVKKYDLAKRLWMILGLVFGGWTLMAINVAIWTKTYPDNRNCKIAKDSASYNA